MQISDRFNPFPGLRPFRSDEDRVFFGREKQLDDLLRKLRTTRLVTVLGTSGSGKSSLVYSGLIPSLQSGYMVKAGSNWGIAVLRPGSDPIGNLVDALDTPALAGKSGELQEMYRLFLEATLRRSSRGLISCFEEARLPTHKNVLVVVDQFEELFRFKHSREVDNASDDALAFVKLLLEATAQSEIPIYVVLTMRSDFLGDCLEYPGLPEKINEGQYLIPRMTRDELRLAIKGPVAVSNATIAPRLVTRLLNDVGDDADQLPILQHALMRTWDRWAADGANGTPLDLSHYDAVGTMEEALSLHADEAYNELDADGKLIAERLFKTLTDTTTDPRGIRRPTRVDTVSKIAETTEDTVIAVADLFRKQGRTFLMPPGDVALTGGSILDISHESLMRVWKRLGIWAEEENAAGERYLEVAAAAARWEQGLAGLWRDPELEIGLKWREHNDPTDAWAKQYAPEFGRAIRFLEESKAARDREEYEREHARKKKVRRWRQLAAAFALAGVLIGISALVAVRQSRRADRNQQVAVAAVDTMLMMLGDTASDVAPELRADLLAKAQNAYSQFGAETRGLELRERLAVLLQRFGGVYAALGNSDSAQTAYRQSIDSLRSLRAEDDNPAYRQQLANVYNSLGVVLKPSSRQSARDNYNLAIALQDSLVEQFPDSATYQQERARSYYNRGITFNEDEDNESARADYELALGILDSLITDSLRVLRVNPSATIDVYWQEMARVFNNLGNLGEDDEQASYERAIEIAQRVAASPSRNRGLVKELAVYHNNLALFQQRRGQFGLAEQEFMKAAALFDSLAAPIPILDIERGNTYSSLGFLLSEADRNRDAEDQLQKALEIWETLDRYYHGSVVTRDDFQQRYGNTLFALARIRTRPGQYPAAIGLMSRAAERHRQFVAGYPAYCGLYRQWRDALPAATRAAANTAIGSVLDNCDTSASP